MDALFVPLAGAVGASVDQVKLISCLLVAYPLGSVFVRIPVGKPGLKHLFNIAVSLFFFFPMLGMYSGFLQLLGDILITYFTAKFSSKSKVMPWFIFVFILGHLMFNHIIRVIYSLSYETIEVTGPQMVLTMKLTTFAWNVWDGRRDEKELDKWQLEKSVREFPSLLEFLGYALYFPGVLVGPSLEFADYMNLVHERTFTTPGSQGKEGGRRLPAGRKRVGYRKFVTGLAFLGAFIVFGGSNNFSVMATPWFAEQSWGKRVLLAQFYGTCERTKYYAIWTLTEGASILTGYGFTGFTPTGQSTWNGAANVIPIVIEFPSNFKVLLDSWNMKANVWLRECVYKRVTPKGQKPGFWSSMLTFATSAFWHGAQIGYYLTFLMGGFITSAARLARVNFRPFFLPPEGQPPTATKRLYDLTTAIVSLLVLNYTAAPFMLLTWKDSIAGWSVLGWYGHIVIIGSLVFFYAGGSKICRGLQVKMGIVGAGKGSGSKKFGAGTQTPVAEKSGFQVPPSLDRVVPPPI
ncbi:MBOAT, membrane-bound O-acyltransferase family-domain-containing protein [Rhodocollybia butyracea]|uniref:MBOAT, membrane-bound O-acyltransferase family-domain-containing protein n=1 Tax=Rhodocollybia butyracea TaxID=206335 RepID=A0A9P5UEV2_9AGAR|nr:MBOAT, membrane-bound O-acyltransferase family-domain-containing protein [Rhodocollybia butyracea]